MSADRVVYAKSPEWELCRYEKAGCYRLEYVGPDVPPTAVPVYGGIEYRLAAKSHRTRVTVAEAGMLAAFTGCSLTKAANNGFGPNQFRKYFRNHVENLPRANEADL